MVTLEASKSLFLLYSNPPSRILQMTQSLQRLNKSRIKSQDWKKRRPDSNLEVNFQGLCEGNFWWFLGG